MLSNLVYVSVRKPICTDAEIQKILEVAQTNNQSLDITGVLLYSSTHFVQYLEGDYDEIFGLYEQIKSDDRHKNVVLVTSSTIRERFFPSWQMGGKQYNSVEYLTSLNEEEQSVFQDILSGKAEEKNSIFGMIKKIFR